MQYTEKILTTQKAFDVFSSDYVDLIPDRAKKAIDSRNWLIEQIEKSPQNDLSFPNLYKEKNGKMMGSFSRKTKIRPLDDIDLLIVFSANGTTYHSFSDRTEMYVPETAQNLLLLSNEGKLNSIKVLNKIKSALKSVQNYSQAEIRYNQEAVTLKLKSYEWNFDIVPAFFTSPESNGRTYFVIPDGKGNWKKTDPRIDAQRTTKINQWHSKKLLKVIRLLKHWNNRPLAPKMGSYLLENMILDYFEWRSLISSPQVAIRDFFEHLKIAIYSNCIDPKGIQGDINTLNLDEKIKVAAAAGRFATICNGAIIYEILGDHENAIKEWKKVFGDNFPSYG
ncbi:nucleotidyltransferase [Neobacillus drentensis]|uniref:nucleotidyltransferase n=1 Tax=Neobacillus drentensis TaxID=220684 RepID=UPI003001CDD5